MKKIFSILALSMMMVCVASCGGSKNGENQEGQEAAASGSKVDQYKALKAEAESLAKEIMAAQQAGDESKYMELAKKAQDLNSKAQALYSQLTDEEKQQLR